MIESDEITYLMLGIAILIFLILIKEILFTNEIFVEWFRNATGFRN
jgi:hypothetical protein